MTRLQTVVELDSFVRRAKAIMSDAEREGIVSFVAANPEAGVPLGGGLRKLRVPRPGGGKSGGYRTIYVFGGSAVPLFLVTVYAKNEKDNLSNAEQAAAVELAKQLLATYGVQK
jgi:hypothetical protein